MKLFPTYYSTGGSQVRPALVSKRVPRFLRLSRYPKNVTAAKIYKHRLEEALRVMEMVSASRQTYRANESGHVFESNLDLEVSPVTKRST